MNRHMELCEARRLMSVAASAAAGTLYVYGDNEGNGLAVEKSGSDLVVKKYVDGTSYTEFYRVKANKVNTIKMYGRGGPDTLSVANNVAATAYINGEAGADFIQGGGGQNYLYGHSQNYPETDDSASDTLLSGFGPTTSYGQKGSDHFFTGIGSSFAASGEDLLLGGDGNDTFNVVGTRKVYAWGDNGDDTFESHQLGNKYMKTSIFMGGFGTDTLDMSSFSADLDIYLGYPGKGNSGIEDGRHWISVLPDVENAVGGKGDDDIVGNDGSNTLWGGEGDDRLYGADSNDRLYGQNGNDDITGDWGNDRIFGGAGFDRLRGHDGNDRVYGGPDADTIYGDAGNDSLYGEAGNDDLTGGKGNDLHVGGTGDDEIFAADGLAYNDIIFGGNEDGTGQSGFDKVSMDIYIVNPSMRDFAFGVDEIN